MLKIEATGLTAAEYGKSSELVVGELAVVIGNPLGQLGGTVTDGIISALDREITIDGRTMNLLQTNAAINPGNSGGGLFDSQGKLVGIVAAKSSGEDVEGLGFAIPIDDAIPVIEEIVSNGYVAGRVSLGMDLIDRNAMTQSFQSLMFGFSQSGVYVDKVETGSNADKAGFRAGDRILAMEDTKVSKTADVTQILSKYQVGDQISVTIYRGGQTATLSLTLGEYTP